MFNRKMRNILKQKRFNFFFSLRLFSCSNDICCSFSLFAIVFILENTRVNNWLFLKKGSIFNSEAFSKSVWYNYKIMCLFIYFKYKKHKKINDLFAHFSGLGLTLLSVVKVLYIMRNQYSVSISSQILYFAIKHFSISKFTHITVTQQVLSHKADALSVIKLMPFKR